MATSRGRRRRTSDRTAVPLFELDGPIAPPPPVAPAERAPSPPPAPRSAPPPVLRVRWPGGAERTADGQLVDSEDGFIPRDGSTPF